MKNASSLARSAWRAKSTYRLNADRAVAPCAVRFSDQKLGLPNRARFRCFRRGASSRA
jgi:hypothetical protein